MEKIDIQLDQLVNLLIQKSGLTVGELAEKIGVTRQTLSNWRKGIIHTLDSQSIKKVNDAMLNNPWGIKLGNISGSTIEIYNLPNSSDANIKYGSDKKVTELEQLVIKLTSENILLREKIEKYETNKK